LTIIIMYDGHDVKQVPLILVAIIQRAHGERESGWYRWTNQSIRFLKSIIILSTTVFFAKKEFFVKILLYGDNIDFAAAFILILISHSLSSIYTLTYVMVQGRLRLRATIILDDDMLLNLVVAIVAVVCKLSLSSSSSVLYGC